MSTLKYAATILTFSSFSLIFGACQPKVEDTNGSNSSLSTSRYLYAVSGGCYAGSATISTASKTIVRYNLETGNIDRTVYDYNSSSGDTPVAAMNLDDGNLLVLIENTSGRRLEKVSKTEMTRSTVATYPTGTWNSVARDIVPLALGGYMIPRSASMEKYSSGHSRVPTATSTFPWLNAPAGACATSTTLVTRAVELSNGKVIFSHATANQNRVGLLPANMNASTDCLTAQASPIPATAFPTAMAYIQDAGGVGVGHLLVAYASSTAGSNLIGQYTVDETANTITPSAATNHAAFANVGVLNGVTAMAYDSATGYVYIANGSTSLSNTIEKFTYSAATKTLTRVGSASFAGETINSRCINSLFLAN